MVRLFFDIETVPCDEEHKELFIEILRSRNGNAEKEETELHESMSFDGALGRICSIAYIKDNEQGIIEEGVLSGDETEIVQKFWEVARGVYQFIGHNIYEFDFPFIYKRSRILGVVPRDDISFARYRSIPIYDTMKEWDLWGSSRPVKLDLLAKVFGLQTSKDEMHGGEVWKYFKEGKIEEINKYCMKDVVLTREVYYKMLVRDMPEIASAKEEDLF
jgi:predicted PolB exonuclease-like 3'-5' exonuclease